MTDLEQCPETGILWRGVEDIDVSCSLKAGHEGPHKDESFGEWEIRDYYLR